MTYGPIRISIPGIGLEAFACSEGSSRRCRRRLGAALIVGDEDQVLQALTQEINDRLDNVEGLQKNEVIEFVVELDDNGNVSEIRLARIREDIVLRP